MEYKKIDMTSYNIHLIKTKKFKTIDIRICFRKEIKKNEITIRNILSELLTYSTDTYKTKRELSLKTQDLYNTNIFSICYRNGRYSLFKFHSSFLNEKYTEPGMFEESIKLLSDVIFNPNFNDIDSFNSAFRYVKDRYKKKLESIKDNATGYSLMRMLEEMNGSMEYSYRDIGYLEDLDLITLDSLKKYYNELINNSLIDIYIIGDIDDSCVKTINKYFNFKTVKSKKIDQLIKHDHIPKKIKVVKELDNNNQSKLSVGCMIEDLSEFERNYVLTLYNLILGGGTDSKFFKIIREENSLAYYASSSLAKLDSILMIRAGISKENYEYTVKLIKKIMKSIEKGDFTEEDINIAKESYISLLNEIEDNQDAIIEAYFAKDLLNLGDIEERKEMIQKVTKEDIIKVSKKVKITTIFMLEGVGQIEED